MPASAADWSRHFDDVPPALASLLRDLLQEARVQEDRRRGVQRSGGRPTLVEGDMGTIRDVVFPKRSEKSFTEALSDATDLPRATIAAYAGMNPGQLFQMEHGKRPFTKDRLEAVAKVVGVDPGYFHEYRVIVIHEALDAVLNTERSLRAYSQIEPDHHANPRPKTLNSVNGFAYGKNAVTNQIKQGRVPTA